MTTSTTPEPRIEAKRLDADGQVREVPWRETLVDHGSCVWMHLFPADPEEDARFMEDTFEIPIGPGRDATHGYIRPGIDHRSGACSFVLPVIFTGGAEPVYAAVGFFVRGAYLLTVSKEIPPLMAEICEEWIDDPDDVGPTVPKLVYSLLDANVDAFFPVLDVLQDKVEDLEDRIFTAETLHPAEAIATKRQFLEARRQLGPIRDVLNAVIRHGPPMIPNEILPDYQDIQQHVLRLTDSIDLGRDILSSIMDAQLSVVSNRLNEVMRVLTVVSTLMMACSLVAGVYGMNFKRMPELDWVYGYPFSIGLMLTLCIIIYWIFKKNKFV
jgi:magnesium transporter